MRNRKIIVKSDYINGDVSGPFRDASITDRLLDSYVLSARDWNPPTGYMSDVGNRQWIDGYHGLSNRQVVVGGYSSTINVTGRSTASPMLVNFTKALVAVVDGYLACNNSELSVVGQQFTLTDSHLVVDQTAGTPPTFTVSSNAGTGASAAFLDSVHHTDLRGHVRLNFGSGSWASGEQLGINFNKPYIQTPVAIISPANANAKVRGDGYGMYATASTTKISVFLNTAETATVSYDFYYWVIG